MNCELIINIVLGVVIVLLVIKLLIDMFNNQQSSNSNGNSNNEKMNNLSTYVMYFSPGCGWCKKLINEIMEANLEQLFEMRDITTSEGQNQFSKLSESGVPVCLNEQNGKKSVGYKPIDEIIEEIQ